MPVEDKEIGLGLELEEGTFESVALTEDGVLVLETPDGELPVESPEAKEYRKSIESGVRNQLLSIDTNITWSGSLGVQGLFDGTNSSNVYFSSQNITDKHIEITFQQGVTITGFTWTQTSATNQGVWEFQVYNNGSWHTLTQFNYTQSTQSEEFTNSVISTRYRFAGVSGNTSSGPWQYEIKFSTEPAVDSEVAPEGYWESEVIDLEHRFKEFKKIALTSKIPNSAQIGIEIRTSDSGVDFTPYQQTAEDGTFQMPARRYIQVKINLYAGYTAINNIIDFTEKENLKRIHKDYYFESTEQGLKINSDEIIKIPTKKDENYTGEGHVYVADLEKDEFVEGSITKLNIL